MKQDFDISWWYWLATTVLIASGLMGYGMAFYAAIILTLTQLTHFAAREKSITSFPIQVRLAYLGLLLLGQWTPFFFIYWVQLAGGTAMITFGYCPLARILSLLPCNRHHPLTFSLLRRTFCSAPIRGNVLQGLPSEIKP